MIFITNSAKRWKASFKNWRRWYAWRPIILENHFVWFEWVLRKRASSWYEVFWEYKLLKKK